MKITMMNTKMKESLSDKEVVLVALQHNTNALSYPDILMTAIKNDMLFGDVLMRAPEEYKRNKDSPSRMLGHFSVCKEIVLAAVRNDGQALKYALGLREFRRTDLQLSLQEKN